MGNRSGVAAIAFGMMMIVSTSGSIAETRHCSKAAYGGENPYHLTTENQLCGERAIAIQTLWEQNALAKIAGVGGHQLAYKVFPVKPGKQARASIVISSGRTEGMVKYKELIFDLHHLDFAVYIHDHRGQGFSDRLHPGASDKDHPAFQMGHVENFDHYVEDLKTVFDAVVKPDGETKAFLLGHSMGGAIATLYLQRHPQDFAAAVLSSPMHEPNVGGRFTRLGCRIIGRISQNGAPRFAPLTGTYDAKSAKHNHDAEKLFEQNELTHSKVRFMRMRNAYRENPQAKIGGPSGKWVSEACGAGRQAVENADKISRPVLVLQAGNDTAVRNSAQDRFCRNARDRCVGGKPVAIADAYHELFIESDIYRIPAITKALDFLVSKL